MSRALVLVAFVAALAALLSCSGTAPEPGPDAARITDPPMPRLPGVDSPGDPVLAGAAPARGSDPVAMGAELYRSYCLNCHGEDGRGGGSIAAILMVPTPDLTAIAARHGGEFPRDYVLRQINGTEYLTPHGTGLMPVWGVVLNPDFRGEGDGDGREVARREIEALVEYVATLQE